MKDKYYWEDMSYWRPYIIEHALLEGVSYWRTCLEGVHVLLDFIPL